MKIIKVEEVKQGCQDCIGVRAAVLGVIDSEVPADIQAKGDLEEISRILDLSLYSGWREFVIISAQEVI